MFDLSGKTALVSGASGGIGSAIAKYLHQAGASVVISGTRQEQLTELKRQLGKRCQMVVADLSEKTSVDNMFKQAEDVAGNINILVNCAGITRDGLAVRMGDDAWQQVIAVNLTSVFQLSKLALKSMIRQRYGRIINITSVVGFSGNGGQANYCAAKAGVTGMSKAMAKETAARGVTINCIAPGFIETAMTEKLNEQQRAALLLAIPANRMGAVDDVAGAAVFLASNAAGYITGQTIHINGGMLMV